MNKKQRYLTTVINDQKWKDVLKESILRKLRNGSKIKNFQGQQSQNILNCILFETVCAVGTNESLLAE